MGPNPCGFRCVSRDPKTYGSLNLCPHRPKSLWICVCSHGSKALWICVCSHRPKALWICVCSHGPKSLWICMSPWCHVPMDLSVCVPMDANPYGVMCVPPCVSPWTHVCPHGMILRSCIPIAVCPQSPLSPWPHVPMVLCPQNLVSFVPVSLHSCVLCPSALCPSWVALPATTHPQMSSLLLGQG